MSRSIDETPSGVRLMHGDKNRRNVGSAVDLKLSTGMLSHLIEDETMRVIPALSSPQGSRLKRTRFNSRKCLESWLKDATRMSLEKLSFHVKHGTSNASCAGSHNLKVKGDK